MHHVLRIALPALLFLTSLGCSGGPGASPEATFETVKAAAAKEDWRTIVRCMTPKSRETAAGLFAMSMCMAKNEEFVAVLNKHGIDAGRYEEVTNDDSIKSQREAFKKMIEPIADLETFLADALTVNSKQAKQFDPKESVGWYQYSTLTNVEIDGDSATGTHEFEWQGKPATAKVTFKKIDGRWCMDM